MYFTRRNSREPTTTTTERGQVGLSQRSYLKGDLATPFGNCNCSHYTVLQKVTLVIGTLTHQVIATIIPEQFKTHLCFVRRTFSKFLIQHERQNEIKMYPP